MPVHISKSGFKAKALELFRKVEESGETIVVTDHGKPSIEIRRYVKSSRDPLEFLKGSVLRYDDPFEPVGEEWDAMK